MVFLFALFNIALSGQAFAALSSIREDAAHSIVDLFTRELAPVLARERGVKFEILYDTTLPNLTSQTAASAEQHGNLWEIFVWGGSNRPAFVSADSFVLVLCHEVGHHTGGIPYKFDEQGATRWSSAEGQADYFATAVCAKHFLPLLPGPAAEPPADVLAYCSERIPSPADAALCARIIVAAQSLMRDRLDGTPMSWTTTDPNAVTETLGLHPRERGDYAYPSHACQMETLRRGALCQKTPRPSAREVLGLTGAERFCEGEAGRPACWFAP